jgi:hypothetical protein
MFTMRLFGLFAYTAIGAGIGAFTLLEWHRDPMVNIIIGALVGFVVGVNAWVKASRDA